MNKKSKYFGFFYIIQPVLILGCVSFPLDEPTEEYNIKGEILALVAPDSVTADTDFEVQISFPDIYGGTYSHIHREVKQDKIILSPVIHVVRQPGYQVNYSVQTVTAKIRFSNIGKRMIVASGRFGDLSQPIEVVSNVTVTDNFKLRFLFLNKLGIIKPGLNTSFKILDRAEPKTVTISSNSFGIWDTTFADTLQKVRYMIKDPNGVPIYFKAKKGILENGILLFP